MALALMQKAKALLDEVSESDKSFRYSCNASFRESRVASAVHIVETELNEIIR